MADTKAEIARVEKALASFARTLQKAWKLQSAEDNNSHNSRL